jgi:Tfp pilus assembly protein PilF
LIDARTDRHLWAQEYRARLRPGGAAHLSGHARIADEIRVELTPNERARLGGAHTVNPEAHEAYLEGRYYWNQFTDANTKRSLAFFRQAIARDPNYALGYSGLAKYYAAMYIRFGLLPRAEACPKGEAAARKAIELDDSLSDPHLALGALRFWCDWDFQGAESELKRAIRLNPSDSEAPRVYASTLTVRGRGEEAIVEMEGAVEYDPMSAEVKQMFGWDYYEMRQYDQAARQYRKAAAINPKQMDPILGLGNVYAQQGQLDLAIREYRKAIGLMGGEPNPGLSCPLAYAYARAGRRRQAIEVLNQMNQMPGVTAIERAIVYVGLGDKQHALAWLEKAYEDRDTDILSLNTDPVYDPLRSDPRFQALVRRVGL